MRKLLCALSALLMLLSIVGCGKDDSADTTTDAVEAGVVAFTAAEAVFEEGTKVTAETVTAGEVYERAKTAVKAAEPVAQKFTVFEFNAVKDEVKVQPNGKLAVTFRIPDDYSNNVKILYVADDGTTGEITATVNAGERTVVAELAHFSTYVLIDLGETEGEGTTTTAEIATTTEAITTETESTTTTTKPTAATTAIATTTTTKATTTTTKASYSAFKSSNWLFRVIVNDGGQFCKSYTLALSDGDPRIGEAVASPYEEMVPPEYQDQEKPDFEFGGIQWYNGAGGATPLSSVTENGDTVTLIDEDGKQLVLTRTGETTAKVVSNTIAINVKAGDVFTATK